VARPLRALLAAGLALPVVALPADAQPRGGRGAPDRAFASRAWRPDTVAACGRALSRAGGLVWRRTPEGDLEQEPPPACGGGYERRSRTQDPCRDSCFVQNGRREVAVAARFREGNLLLVLDRHGRRFTPAASLQLPEGEVRLLDDAAADRVRRALVTVHGAATSQPRLGGHERVAFYALSWREDRDGWHGALSAAVRGGPSLRLVVVAHASINDAARLRLAAGRDAPVPFKAASRTPAAPPDPGP
jgi:hypothetical protein